MTQTVGMLTNCKEKVVLYYTKDATAVPVTSKLTEIFKPDDHIGTYPWQPVPEAPTKKTKCKVEVVLKDANGVTVAPM